MELLGGRQGGDSWLWGENTCMFERRCRAQGEMEEDAFLWHLLKKTPGKAIRVRRGHAWTSTAH